MIALVIYIICILSGLVFSKSKLVFMFQWLILTIAIAFNRGGLDVDTYEAMYQMYTDLPRGFIFEPEILYQYFANISSSFGLDFGQYTSITSIIAMSILGYVILKNSKQPAIVMSLIMIFPGFDLVIQKRNFLGLVFLVLAIHFWINASSFRVIKYLFFIIIALGFHSVFLIYILLIFFPKYEFFDRFKYFFLLAVILLMPIIPNIAAIVMTAQKFDSYFNNVDMNLETYKSVIFVLLQLFIVGICLKINKLYVKDERIARNMTQLLYFSLLALPFYFYGSNFIRIYRNLLVIFYIFSFFEQKSMLDLVKGKFNLYYLVLLVLVLCHGIVFYFSGVGPGEIILPAFYENLIFNWI